MEAGRSGLTRRRFLGTAAAAIGAGAVVSTGALAGCTPQQGGASTDGSSGAGGGSTTAVLNPQEDYTAFTTDFSALFNPIQIGPLTLKNRIVKSASGSDTWIPDGDVLNQGFLDYYENFAKGGAALVIIETAISKLISMDIPGRTGTGWLGSRIEMAPQLLGPVVERIHLHDAYAGMPIAGPSFDFTEATPDDFKWVQERMVNIALAYQSTGFDMIQLHFSAEQALAKAMTPRGNARTDEYSIESLENRTRFHCELIKAIKEACGADFPIQILMNAVEENDTAVGDNDGFASHKNCIENATAFEAAGADTIYLRLDVPGLHISQFAPDLMFSGYNSEGMTGFGARFDYSQHFNGIVDGSHSGCGLLIDACAAFKEKVSIPVSCAGYMDPRTAPDLINDSVANGAVDYLMMTRPLTVDPELPNKLQEGRHSEIAPCCRCMHCHNKGGPDGSGDEWCRVNAMTQNAFNAANDLKRAQKVHLNITGEELAASTDFMPEGFSLTPAETTKKVLVVGAGPAGLEAARIAAQRGHSVTLYEKDATLGGLVKTAHSYKGDHERLGDLIEYLTNQQTLHGVSVVTDTEVDAELIKSEAPDAVVIAVGGNRENKLASSDETAVVAFEDVASADLGEKVVICGAGAQAVDLALYLLAQGKKVQMVHGGTRAEIDKEQSMWVRTYVRPHLFSQGVKIWCSSEVDMVDDAGLHIVDELGTKTVLECDSVIECWDMVPNTDLYDSIKNDFEAYAAGDCLDPVNIADAILYGNYIGRRI